MEDNNEDYSILQPSSSSGRSLDHIIDVFSELQEWGMKDEHSKNWSLDAYPSTRKWKLRLAGNLCGLQESLYLVLGCPLTYAINNGILNPFGMELKSNDPHWFVIYYTLWFFPCIHFFYCIRFIRRLKGEFSSIIISIFFTSRALSIMMVSLATSFVYGWITPQYLNWNLFSNLFDIKHYLLITGLSDILIIVLKGSIYTLIPFSLILSLVPLVYYKIRKASYLTSKEVTREFTD